MRSKRLGLALGGGSARGMAHVGVLQVLEREGIHFDCVAGTSVGSLVGAGYAAGLRGEALVDMALRFRWRHIARPAWSRRGWFTFAPLEWYLRRTVGDLTFDDLPTPFAAVAADLETCQPVILRTGSVARAVRASCSVPGVVTPVRWEGRLLADGGVVNNLPISVVRQMGAEVVIAVNLAVPTCQRPDAWHDTAVWAIDTLIVRAGDPPQSADVCISIPLAGLDSLVRTSRARAYLDVGKAAAEEALPAIRAAAG